jgi:hypothetical protein
MVGRAARLAPHRHSHLLCAPGSHGRVGVSPLQPAYLPGLYAGSAGGVAVLTLRT